MLRPRTFLTIKEAFGPLDVDLFASRLTNQLPPFFNWRSDPQTEAVDAFQQDWGPPREFANPPWCLIGRVLSQARQQQAQLVLVAPVWRGQTCTVSNNPGDASATDRPNPRPDSEANRIPNGDGASTSRVACLQERYTGSGLSEEASKLLLQSWRVKSSPSYDSHFWKWTCWCSEWGHNPISGPASDVVNFLAEQGYQLRSTECIQICHFLCS